MVAHMSETPSDPFNTSGLSLRRRRRTRCVHPTVLHAATASRTTQLPAGAGSPYDGPAAQSTDAAGFFKALFDFSFSTFITPKVVKFVYILATVLLVIGWLFWLLAGFAQSAGFGLFILIVGPVVLLVTWPSFA